MNSKAKNLLIASDRDAIGPAKKDRSGDEAEAIRRFCTYPHSLHMRNRLSRSASIIHSTLNVKSKSKNSFEKISRKIFSNALRNILKPKS